MGSGDGDDDDVGGDGLKEKIWSQQLNRLDATFLYKIRGHHSW